jgi:hypothetical protein
MSKSLRIILSVLGLALLVSGAAGATVLETAVARGKPARSVNCDPDAAGFEPDCGDQVAVMLVPFDPEGEFDAQVTIISAQVTVVSTEAACQPVFGDGDETAWACGDSIRPGKNWAMTFQCCADQSRISSFSRPRAPGPRFF